MVIAIKLGMRSSKMFYTLILLAFLPLFTACEGKLRPHKRLLLDPDEIISVEDLRASEVEEDEEVPEENEEEEIAPQEESEFLSDSPVDATAGITPVDEDLDSLRRVREAAETHPTPEPEVIEEDVVEYDPDASLVETDPLEEEEEPSRSERMPEPAGPEEEVEVEDTHPELYAPAEEEVAAPDATVADAPEIVDQIIDGADPETVELDPEIASETYLPEYHFSGNGIALPRLGQDIDYYNELYRQYLPNADATPVEAGPGLMSQISQRYLGGSGPYNATAREDFVHILTQKQTHFEYLYDYIEKRPLQYNELEIADQFPVCQSTDAEPLMTYYQDQRLGNAYTFDSRDLINTEHVPFDRIFWSLREPQDRVPHAMRVDLETMHTVPSWERHQWDGYTTDELAHYGVSEEDLDGYNPNMPTHNDRISAMMYAGLELYTLVNDYLLEVTLRATNAADQTHLDFVSCYENNDAQSCERVRPKEQSYLAFYKAMRILNGMAQIEMNTSCNSVSDFLSHLIENQSLADDALNSFAERLIAEPSCLLPDELSHDIHQGDGFLDVFTGTLTLAPTIAGERGRFGQMGAMSEDEKSLAVRAFLSKLQAQLALTEGTCQFRRPIQVEITQEDLEAIEGWAEMDEEAQAEAAEALEAQRVAETDCAGLDLESENEIDHVIEDIIEDVTLAAKEGYKSIFYRYPVLRYMNGPVSSDIAPAVAEGLPEETAEETAEEVEDEVAVEDRPEEVARPQVGDEIQVLREDMKRGLRIAKETIFELNQELQSQNENGGNLYALSDFKSTAAQIIETAPRETRGDYCVAFQYVTDERANQQAGARFFTANFASLWQFNNTLQRCTSGGMQDSMLCEAEDLFYSIENLMSGTGAAVEVVLAAFSFYGLSSMGRVGRMSAFGRMGTNARKVKWYKSQKGYIRIAQQRLRSNSVVNNFQGSKAFKILNVNKNASPRSIKRAARNLRDELLPDNNPRVAEAVDAITDANLAGDRMFSTGEIKLIIDHAEKMALKHRTRGAMERFFNLFSRGN